jgi:hypothetical protein
MNYILLGLYFSYKSQRLISGKSNKQVGNELITEVDLRKSDAKIRFINILGKAASSYSRIGFPLRHYSSRLKTKKTLSRAFFTTIFLHLR